MVNPSAQQIIDGAADAAVSQQYPNSLQDVVATSGNTSIHITNINEYTTIRVTSPGEPAGNTSELQFNTNGSMDADDGLTYNPTTDSLTVLGNLATGYLLTNNLKYANGVSWNFSSTGYSNANVNLYLPTYVGNLNPNKVSAQLFEGSGANLSNIPAANLTGTITAITAGTVTTAAQPNITAVGTLSSVSVTGNITAGNITATHYGSGAGLTSITGANVTGTVANATNSTNATTAGTANTVAGANVTGTVANATNSTNATFAGTVTSNAQANITSVGTLDGLTATGTINLTGASNVSLGPVGNIRITGGSNGQVLAATSTPGVVAWSTPTTGTLQDVTTNGGNTSVAIDITNTTVSTNYNNGALKVAGGVGIGENLHVLGHIASDSTVYAGHLADFGSWVNPVFVGRDAGQEYVQGALINNSNTGSADWVAYGDSSTTDTGWTDVGFTGSNFSDANYTITKASDGYVFVQGLGVSEGGPQGGNLVLATGGDGANNDIVFGLGSFYANAEFARMDDDSNTFYVGGHAYGATSENPTPKVVNLNVNGNANVGGEFFIKNHNAHGGAGFAGMMTLENDTATNGKKFIRIDSAGKLQIINDAYTDTIFDLADNGDLIVTGNLMPAGNVAKDIGSPSHRFNDLYLAGTTIDLGGTLISTDANGNISLGNVTFTSNSVGDIPVTNRYYVDPTRSAESYTPNGSQAMPFWTVAAAQSAITASGVNPQVEPIFITLLANLTENITLSVGRIYLVGQSGSIHQPIVISGTITVEATSGTLGTNHFSLIGVEVVGPTDAKAIWVKGTYPTRLSLQDVWITANGNSGVGLYQDNTGTGTYTHGGPVKVSHNGTGDVYCFQIMKGTASFSQVETSGATQVGSVGSGGVLTFNDSELDASGDVVLETYGSGILVVTNSLIKNTGGNTCSGIKMNAIANVAGTVSIGQSAFDIEAGTGNAVWLDPNTTLDYMHGGFFAYAGTTFYPNTNTNLSAELFMSPLQSIATNVVQTRAVTLATLGSASSAGAGTKGFITNGNLVASGNFGAAVAGGGSNAVPVYSDGTSWRIG